MKRSKKSIATIVSVIMVVGAMIGGTLAYLQDSKTDSQTFTGGDHVYIESVSHAEISDAKVIPGKSVEFNPTIELNNTVPAYLFVKIEGGEEYLSLENCGMNAWMQLPEDNSVYYREVPAKFNEQNNFIQVFDQGRVEFSSTLTNETIPTDPVTINVRAYAIQSDYIAGPFEAWNAVNNQ